MMPVVAACYTLDQCFSTGVHMHPLGWIGDTKGWNFEKGGIGGELYTKGWICNVADSFVSAV